jgi:hypothetical protein
MSTKKNHTRSLEVIFDNGGFAIHPRVIESPLGDLEGPGCVRLWLEVVF